MAKARKPATPETLSEQTEHLYEVLNNQTDLAVIMIATSFIDASLSSLLKSTFKDGSTAERLLSHNGLLGSLRAKADLCYCLGIIPESSHGDILTVGEIRNYVAHDHLHRDFSDPQVNELCMSLSMPMFGSEKVAANRFRNVAVRLTNRLIMEALERKQKREAERPRPIKEL